MDDGKINEEYQKAVNEEVDAIGYTQRPGPLKLESKFEYDQTVHFIENRVYHCGKCAGIRGSDGDYSRHMEILVKVTYGDLGTQFWVPEENLFFTKDELKMSLFGE